VAYYLIGDEPAARTAFQKALAIGTDFPGKEETNRRLAILAIDPKTADPSARSALEDYLRANPNDPVALLRLAEIQQRDGNADQAIKTYEKLIAANPQFAPALRQLALLDAQRSPDDPKTYDLVEKARLAYPDDPELAKALGILSYRRGSYRRAAELLQLAAAKQNDDPELLYYLGMSHYQLKQYVDAQVELDRALSLNLAPEEAEKARLALQQCCNDARAKL
jgi:Flp pilus assembly protein TadD